MLLALTVCILALLTATPSYADVRDLNLGDPHLSVIPRTPAEAAHVADVTSHSTVTKGHPSEARPGGGTTTPVRGDVNAFSQVSGNIRPDKDLDFVVGNALFRRLWHSAPSEDAASDGLGPLYNALSCEQCHLRDGRGHAPAHAADDAVSMFLRVAVPGTASEAMSKIEGYIATAPDPIYGSQLQDFAVQGHQPEAQLRVTYSDQPVTFADGTTVMLRRPHVAPEDLNYGPLHRQATLSARVAPQMIGLGLLEAIPTADILALADPNDADGDGISGRANVVWSKTHNAPMLGRFGLKAGVPTLLQQSASAFAGDMGISNSIFQAAAGDCTLAQDTCLNAPHGDADARVFEIDAIGLELVTFYSRNLAVPARRNIDDPIVQRGKTVFLETGCAQCHQPSFVTHRLEGQPEQSFQHIWPYTDMLLHDMGTDLADQSPEGRARGREWRTPPLWGIGLTHQVSGHSTFLHDGRARSLLEAVLWHGGEAAAQRDKVTQMPAQDRKALIAFLHSL